MATPAAQTAAHVVAATAPALPLALMLPLVLIGTLLLAYLIGSIPFGVILAKLFKVGDLRQIGSGNIGATNMLRAGGKKLAAATLACDMAKGFIAVKLCGMLINHLLAQTQATTGDGIQFDGHVLLYLSGFYAVAGHVFPVWLKGKGGKGVATALGALLAFSPIVGMLALSCWLAVFSLTLYSSLSALVSISLAPLACGYILGKNALFPAVLIAVLVVYRHKDNIRRLMAGEEPKSSLSKKAP